MYYHRTLLCLQGIYRWLGVLVGSRWLAASPVAWVSLGLTIFGTTTGIVYNYAQLRSELHGEIATLTYQVQRNREEATDKFKSHEASMNTMYTALSSIHSVRTDVEVIKSQMQQIVDSVKRIESTQRRQAMPLHGRGP